MGAIWAMNRFTLAAVMKPQRQRWSLYLAAKLEYADAPFGTICGIPVAPDFDHMADIATNSLSIVVGNSTKPFKLLISAGISVVRDNITSPGDVNLYISKRTGGDVVNPKQCALLNLRLNGVYHERY